jgi:hypothetical protein
MDFNATIDLIIKDLKETSDIIDDLKKYPGVPALQVELAKSKCKSAGEVIGLLKTLKDNSFFTEKEPVQQRKVELKPQPEEDKPLSVKEAISPVAEERRTEVDAPEAEPVHMVKEPEPKKREKNETDSAILADKFTNQSNSFNEQLGTIRGDDDIVEILKTKPITSLVEAIGLNDKFLFISEIFNGNKTEYNKAILRLENAENLTDARAVIMSYRGDSNENEAVRQLLDLLKRKFPSDE